MNYKLYHDDLTKFFKQVFFCRFASIAFCWNLRSAKQTAHAQVWKNRKALKKG